MKIVLDANIFVSAAYRGGNPDKIIDRLECAAAANADYVISGDKHLLELKEHREIQIVKAAEYLEIVNSVAR